MNAISSLLRRQLRTPLFALIVTVLVAAVVAFNASAFSAIHALRWKALPYVDGERLVELQARLVNYGFDVGLTENLRQAVIADTAHFSGAPRCCACARRWRGRSHLADGASDGEFSAGAGHCARAGAWLPGR
jgi:hypothetical protein